MPFRAFSAPRRSSASRTNGNGGLFLPQRFVDGDRAPLACLERPLCELVPIELEGDRVDPRRYLDPRRGELQGGVAVQDDFRAFGIAVDLRPGDARGRSFRQG